MKTLDASDWLKQQMSYQDRKQQRARAIYGETEPIPPPLRIKTEVRQFVVPTWRCADAMLTAREELGMDRVKLARLAGVSSAHVENAELGGRGKRLRRVWIETLRDIARILEVDIEIDESQTRMLKVRV